MFSAGQVTSSQVARQFLLAVNDYCAGDANQSHDTETICGTWCPTEANGVCTTPSPRPPVETFSSSAYPQGFINFFGDANHLGSLGYQSSDVCGVINALKVNSNPFPQPGAVPACQSTTAGSTTAPTQPPPSYADIAAQAAGRIAEGQAEQQGSTAPAPTVVEGEGTDQGQAVGTQPPPPPPVDGAGQGQVTATGTTGQQPAPAAEGGASLDLSGFQIGLNVNLDLMSVFSTKSVEGGNWPSDVAGDDPDINAGNTTLSFYGSLMVDLGYAFPIDSRGDVLYIGGYLGLGWGRTVQPVNLEGTNELLPPDLLDVYFGGKIGPNFVLSAEKGVALMPYVAIGGMYRTTSGGDPNSGISFPTERDGVPVQDFSYTAFQLGLGAVCSVRVADWAALNFGLEYRRDITSVGYYETHTQDGEAVRNIYFSPDYFNLLLGAVFTF